MEEQMEREIAGYDVTEIENFVVKRSNQYLERFERLAQNKRPKFNWAAAIFGIYWMGYRKMWREGIIYYACYTIFDLLISAIIFFLHKFALIGTAEQAYNLFYIPVLINIIVMGMIGDRIYWRNIRRRTDYAHLPQEIRENKIGFLSIHKECKGTSIWLGALPMLFWKELFDKLFEFLSFIMAYYIGKL